MNMGSPRGAFALPRLLVQGCSTRLHCAAVSCLSHDDKMARRWMQSNSGDESNPLAASKERIRQDHNYCVDLVRDRDREGYCKYEAFRGDNSSR
jgi:hypothetical protein